MLSCITYHVRKEKDIRLWGLPFRPRIFKMLLNICRKAGKEPSEILKSAGISKKDFSYAHFSLEKLSLVEKQLLDFIDFEYEISFS